MKSNKKFDSVKMMREIRDKVSSDIMDMSPEQILEYIKKGPNDYDELIANHKQAVISQRIINL